MKTQNKKHLKVYKSTFIYPDGRSISVQLASKRKLFKLLTNLTDKVAWRQNIANNSNKSIGSSFKDLFF
jgi:hypothetical protein